MSSNLKRTSMALDEESLAILDDLSAELGISKAEVMRRSLKQAREQHAKDEKKMTPLEAIQALMKDPPLTKAEGDIWLQSLRAERDAWGDPWAESLNESAS